VVRFNYAAWGADEDVLCPGLGGCAGADGWFVVADAVFHDMALFSAGQTPFARGCWVVGLDGK
jgi:hypothetical protein